MYCSSRYFCIRRKTRTVSIGDLKIGSGHPIALQSMTTTPTMDIAATVRQSIELAEAGCDLVRITAQNLKAAEALGPIREQFSAAGFAGIPLVADIHFLPQAAMEAAKHFEKVRINPGNYADKKKFALKEYSDSEYNAELERLHDAFSPIILRCRDLGRAMRIGTNHGSLSDRILNRYGDTPLGMCESALEFIRIAESHGYHEIVLSMKASNPKVAIQAYRLMVQKMGEEGMAYPLHLGVTEAGDGDDARVKSSIGIGSLLYDGLGDTIRVSLTEDPVAEIPVARALADKAMALWRESVMELPHDDIDPYSYSRRPVEDCEVGAGLKLGVLEPPLVIQPGPPAAAIGDPVAYGNALRGVRSELKDTPIEGLFLHATDEIMPNLQSWRDAIGDHVGMVVWQIDQKQLSENTIQQLRKGSRAGDIWLTGYTNRSDWIEFCTMADLADVSTALAIDPNHVQQLFPGDLEAGNRVTIVTVPDSAYLESGLHALGVYRQLAGNLRILGDSNPIWIRNTPASFSGSNHGDYQESLMEASILTGALLCDGIGDLVSVETIASIRDSTRLSYTILQGARARTSKTEFVACPSCGRTLFDLQSTTQRIRSATGHLTGVTIAVMGCIVNGPGEMADADFGYVGGAPGKVNLYVGKKCVKFHIPEADAVQALIDLIKQYDKWREPDSHA